MAARRTNGTGHGALATQFGGPNGNPPGRPRGRKTRIAFQAEFIADVADQWAASGKGILRIIAVEEPMKFAQLCAALMPKQLEADLSTPLSDMSDDELAALRRLLAQEAEQPVLEAEGNEEPRS